MHATTQAQYQVQGGLLLDVVVRQGAPILQLLASKDQALLVRRNALLGQQRSSAAGQEGCLLLDLLLDVVNGVGGLNIQSDGLASQGLHKDLHGWFSQAFDFRLRYSW
uniref:Uncharacterized protein n=1 Tax=Heterosigma akashiwo TaxID=2829 RepID=A0A7S3Y0M9_HETAK